MATTELALTATPGRSHSFSPKTATVISSLPDVIVATVSNVIQSWTCRARVQEYSIDSVIRERTVRKT